MNVRFTLDGVGVSWEVEPGATLLDALRAQGFKGVKRGCSDGTCGACGILVDGQIMNACLMFAAQAEGRAITTIHGLGTPRHPHPLQEAFVAAGAVQCGFCTPAMILATKALLDENPSPSEGEVREALDGTLCRCTGYVKILEAVEMAAAKETP